MSSIPDLPVPLCPHCGDPLTTGCLPSAGICVVEPYENPNLRYAPGMSAVTDDEWAALYPNGDA